MNICLTTFWLFFSVGLQLSPAYQRLLAEEAWPSADNAIFATPSLLYVTAGWACQRIISKFEFASCKALQFGSTIPLCALANEKPLRSPVKRKHVLVPVCKLLASVWARHRLCTLEIPEPPNFRQDWGIEISGTDEVPVEWYSPGAKLVGRSAFQQTSSIPQHPGTRAAADPSWRDQLANALTVGVLRIGLATLRCVLHRSRKSGSIETNRST